MKFPRPPAVPIVIAHRGAPFAAPENTIPSFIVAAAQDVEWFECDVHLTSDGVPYVMHDSTLHRTTNGTGFGYRRTWAELRTLDAGAWFDPFFTGTHIPSLAEVLAWLPAEAHLMVEIKARSFLYYENRDPLRRVVECVRASGRTSDVVITSFDHRLLFTVRELDADVGIGLLPEMFLHRPDLIKRLRILRASWYIHSVLTLTRHDADVVRLNGVRVAVYNATSPRALRHAKRCGVNAVITNDVIAARRFFDVKGRV